MSNQTLYVELQVKTTLANKLLNSIIIQIDKLYLVFSPLEYLLLLDFIRL